MKELLEQLRGTSINESLAEKTILIPDGCEKYGFVQGEYKLTEFLHFIADMLEE